MFLVKTLRLHLNKKIMKQVKLFFLAAFCSVFNMSAFAWPDAMFFAGGPFGGEWSLDARSEAFEKDADDPTVFYYRGYIGYPTHSVNNTEVGMFKIVDGPAWNGFHPKGSANYTLSMNDLGKALPMLATDEREADTKWVLPEDHSMDGWYKIKLTTAVGNRTFTIESFTPAQSDYTQGLFIMGGPFVNDAGSTDWLVYNNYVRMERDRENPNLFHYKGYIERAQWGNEPGMFKILTKHGWGTEFHPGENNVALTSLPVGQAQTMTLDGNDTKWELPEDGSGNGYWDFTVDPKNLTLTVNEFIHDFDYFTEMYLIGDAVPAGWNFETPEILVKKSRGVYEWTGTLSAGSFKIIKHKDDLGGSYVANSENKAVVLGTPNNLKYERNYTMYDSGNDYKFVIADADAGKEVTITVNLIDKTVLINLKQNQDTNLQQSAENLVSVYAALGKIFVRSKEASQKCTVAIFSIDGRQIKQISFCGNYETTLPQGSYIVRLETKAGLVTKQVIVNK